jgi:predicted dinucleotide-binding enzyme
MNVGIIGSGNIGSNLGQHLAKAGYSVTFSSRHLEKLQYLADEIGQKAKVGTVKEAADFGQIIVLAIPFKYISDTATQVGELSGKILIDTTNPYPQRDGQVAAEVLANIDITASQYTAQQFPTASVVKVFNTIYYVNLRDKAFATERNRMAVPYAGDHAEAKQTIAQMLTEIGFAGVDIGTLAESSVMEPGAVLYNKVLSSQEVRSLIS